MKSDNIKQNISNHMNIKFVDKIEKNSTEIKMSKISDSLLDEIKEKKSKNENDFIKSYRSNLDIKISSESSKLLKLINDLYEENENHIITIHVFENFDKKSEKMIHLVQEIALDLIINSWKYSTYKESNKKKHNINIFINDEKICKTCNDFLTNQSELLFSIFWAKEMIYSPSNELTPEVFAERIEKLFEKTNIHIEILDEEDIQKIGLNLVYAVGKGSANKPRFVVLKKGKNPKIAIIGKGVNFDTGGISIKPSNGMEEMISDMSGAAASAASLYATLKSKTDLYVILPLVENMVGSYAAKPGDIFRAYDGTSVRVLNTDAEGRLIVGDATAYAVKKLNVDTVVTICTLTGAARVVYGTEYACLCSSDSSLIDELITAGKSSREFIYPLPFGNEYESYIESTDADMDNIASKPGAGVISGGKFIAKFANNKKDDKDKKHVKFAHIDIGATARINNNYTAFGVKLLSQYILNLG